MKTIKRIISFFDNYPYLWYAAYLVWLLVLFAAADFYIVNVRGIQ